MRFEERVTFAVCKVKRKILIVYNIFLISDLLQLGLSYLGK